MTARQAIPIVVAALLVPASTAASRDEVVAARARACDRAASVSGADSAKGTVRRPFRTVGRLVGALRPGETGCLLGGTYVENVSISRGGRRRARITIRSAPGMRARVLGYVLIRDSANFVTLAHLDVDGHDVTPITVHVYGDDAVLSGLNVTNRDKRNEGYTGSCILLGRYGAPTFRPLVEKSRIHDCGSSGHDHGIYAEFPRAAIIRDSYIYDSPGYGISMYPDAQDTFVTRNVIDGNGHGNVTFSGEDGGEEYPQDFASSRNTLTRNVIANARSRYNVESFFPSLQPIGNSVTLNCVWNAPWGNFGYTSGYSRARNIERNPLYLDRRNKDFRLQPGSPCRGMGPTTVP
jgi:hypothetical protein